jgi:hypothetical protein
VGKLNTIRLVVGLVLLVAGIALVSVGFFVRPEPTCGQQVMKPGDVCVQGGKLVSYQDRKNAIGVTNIVELGGGVAGVVLGGVLVAVSRRRQRTASPSDNQIA